MTKSRIIIRKDLFLFLCLIACSYTYIYSQDATFPYFTSGSNSSEFTVIPGATFSPIFSSRGVQLTTDAKTKESGVYLKNLKFPSQLGYIISFEYEMSGSGTTQYGFADGLTMILFDGTVTVPSIGQLGSGLGYAPINTGVANTSKPGFTKGYFAIGLDVFGSFHERITDPTHSRNGVYDAYPKGTTSPSASKTLASTLFPPLSATASKSFVTVRGSYDKSNQFKGYPVLTAVSTNISPMTRVELENSPSSPIWGNYSFEKSYNNTFSIRNGTYTTSPTSPNYRKVIATIYVSEEKISKARIFYLTVQIQHGTTTTIILEDFKINGTNSPLYYKELSAPTTPNNDQPYAVAFDTPETFNLAFAASTGAGSQAHYIRNIRVDLPFAAVTDHDSKSNVCYECGSSIVVHANDYGFASNIYAPDNRPEESNRFLDTNTFQFRLYNPLTGGFDDTPNKTEHTIAGVGTFKYINTGDENSYVQFFPDQNTIDSGNYPTSASIYYNIKNKKADSGQIMGDVDISHENFRSNTSQISFEFNPSAPKPPKHLIINNDYRKE